MEQINIYIGENTRISQDSSRRIQRTFSSINKNQNKISMFSFAVKDTAKKNYSI